MNQPLKYTLLIAFIAWCIFMNYGCMVIWTDDVFIGTVLKVVDANDLYMISEPNYLEIGSGDSKTENDKIKASALIGTVPVVVESK